MHRKTIAVRLGLSALLVAIVVPLASGVNHFAKISKLNHQSPNLRADGTPIPPLPPPKGVTLVADGTPIPPLPPPTKAVLVADGTPIPPLPPPKEAVLVADGTPIPPLPPPKLFRSQSLAV